MRTRHWLLIVAVAGSIAVAQTRRGESGRATRPPNILLIITDDQGYGDLGVHGNPKIRTPHLDRLASQSVRFRSFYVSPVCSPTRASLLTGRYNYRTGVVDTYLGRSLMHQDEMTLAEMLSRGGYRTGIFGKWHLGDSYPLRAMDQGFQESLTLNGGGIGQPSDPPGGESYFDPLLRRNGQWVKTKGYVSDVLAEAAIDFIRRHRDRAFFAYLAFNAPHTPLEVPAGKYASYRGENLRIAAGQGHPLSPKFDHDTTAKVYGMVENIDDNVGRVLATLDALELSADTLVVFLTDNGPQQPRHNAGMLRLKGTVNEGGIRVPLFVRWSARLPADREVDRIAAHIDVTPTVLEAAGIAAPAGVHFDGRSLLPLLENRTAGWPDRALFFQWHRGDIPQRGRAFAVRTQQHKLVQWQGAAAGASIPAADPALYDMAVDPLEERDIAAGQPEIAQRLRREYDHWFDDVTRGRDFTDAGIPRIVVGDARENPVRLTRQDWRGPEADWTPTSVGYWEVDVRRAGRYSMSLRFPALPAAGLLRVSVGETTVDRTVPAGAATLTLSDVRLAAGRARISAHITQPQHRIGMSDVVLQRR